MSKQTNHGASCAVCNDTGESGGNSGYYDCTAPGCTAAADRLALWEFVNKRKYMVLEELGWAIHRRAVALTTTTTQADWISVSECLPEVGEWAIVVQDWGTGDYLDQKRNPQRQVFCAQLREVGDDGFLRKEVAREVADEQKGEVYHDLVCKVGAEHRAAWEESGAYPDDYAPHGNAIHAEVIKRMAAMKEAKED